MKEYKILGIIAGAHSCGAAYIVGDKVVAVIEEERLNRIKPFFDLEANFERYPLQSILCLINRHGLNVNEVDYFTSFLPFEYIKYVLKSLVDYELDERKFIRIDHHESHAALSYYLSGFNDDTLVFCADASGANGYSSKTYVGSGGNLQFKHGITLQHKSLGHFYSALTEFLGFKRLKDEGKVVGLSGHGQFWEDLYTVWKDVIVIDGLRTDQDNHYIESGDVYVELYNRFFSFVGSKYWKNKAGLEDVAFTGQKIFEEKVVELICNNQRLFPNCRKLAVSGGIFANVKLNKRINELKWVDELFVLPPMGDEGLAFGCAISVYKRLNETLHPIRLPMYLGNEYSREEVLNASSGFKFMELDIDFITRMILDKKIIGLYQGKSEHGPRALGNRSIICDCRHSETYNILNTKLQRNDYMPFAPAVLDEDVDMIFDITKSKYTAEFMTLLVDTKQEWQDKIPTVVHPKDKTARIQIVKKDTNELFYSILKSYKSETGAGILVNTSFNVHNEPIVETPQDAFNHLRNGIIDYLVTPYGIFY